MHDGQIANLDRQATEGITVGIDGSSSSAAAAEWAARQAELTDTTLHAITTWHSPTNFGDPMPMSEEFDPAAEATKVLEEAVAKLRASHPGVDIHTSVTEGYRGRSDSDSDSERSCGIDTNVDVPHQLLARRQLSSQRRPCPVSRPASRTHIGDAQGDAPTWVGPIPQDRAR